MQQQRFKDALWLFMNKFVYQTYIEELLHIASVVWILKDINRVERSVAANLRERLQVVEGRSSRQLAIRCLRHSTY